jgi:hypothetical protein
MSLVKVQGNVSGTGTLTIAAPNTNSDRTLNLPDQTGTLLTGSGAIGVNASAATNSLVIDASGNVGIGTSSPSAKLVTSGPAQFIGSGAVFPTTGCGVEIVGAPNGSPSYIQAYNRDNSTWQQVDLAGSTVSFRTNGSERARIDSSGNLLVAYTSGGTAAGPGVVKAAAYNTKAGLGAALGANVFNIDWGGSTATLYIDTVNVGNISLTSDYRIKRNIETQAVPALDRVMQLRPVTYQMADYGELFKASDDIKEGFIAHELQEVIPSAVDGEKNDPNQIQSLKLDALVSVLTKAIQELKAIVDAQGAEIAALKGTA